MMITEKNIRDRLKVNSFVWLSILFILLSCSWSLAATVTFNVEEGAWSVSSNWDTGVLPGSADIAVIDGERACNFNTTASVQQLELGAQSQGTLNVSGGTLTTGPGDQCLLIGEDSENGVGVLNMSGGEIISNDRMAIGGGFGQGAIATVNLSGDAKISQVDGIGHCSFAYYQDSVVDLTMSGTSEIAITNLASNQFVDFRLGAVVVNQSDSSRFYTSGNIRTGVSSTTSNGAGVNWTMTGGTIEADYGIYLYDDSHINIGGSGAVFASYLNINGTCTFNISNNGSLNVKDMNVLEVQALIDNFKITGTELQVSTVDIGGTMYTQVMTALANVLTADFNVPDGDWSVAGNWDPAELPFTNDTVRIDGSRVCNFNTDASVADVNLGIDSNGTLNVNGGTLRTVNLNVGSGTTGLGTVNLQAGTVTTDNLSISSGNTSKIEVTSYGILNIKNLSVAQVTALIGTKITGSDLAVSSVDIGGTTYTQVLVSTSWYTFNISIGDWSVAGNWLPVGLPGSSSAVLITDSRVCDFNTTASVGRLQLGVNTDGTLNVDGGTLDADVLIIGLGDGEGTLNLNDGVITTNGLSLNSLNSSKINLVGEAVLNIRDLSFGEVNALIESGKIAGLRLVAVSVDIGGTTYIQVTESTFNYNMFNVSEGLWSEPNNWTMGEVPVADGNAHFWISRIYNDSTAIVRNEDVATDDLTVGFDNSYGTLVVENGSLTTGTGYASTGDLSFLLGAALPGGSCTGKLVVINGALKSGARMGIAGTWNDLGGDAEVYLYNGTLEVLQEAAIPFIMMCYETPSVLDMLIAGDSVVKSEYMDVRYGVAWITQSGGLVDISSNLRLGWAGTGGGAGDVHYGISGGELSSGSILVGYNAGQCELHVSGGQIKANSISFSNLSNSAIYLSGAGRVLVKNSDPNQVQALIDDGKYRGDLVVTSDVNVGGTYYTQISVDPVAQDDPLPSYTQSQVVGTTTIADTDVFGSGGMTTGFAVEYMVNQNGKYQTGYDCGIKSEEISAGQDLGFLIAVKDSKLTAKIAVDSTLNDGAEWVECVSEKAVPVQEWSKVKVVLEAEVFSATANPAWDAVRFYIDNMHVGTTYLPDGSIMGPASSISISAGTGVMVIKDVSMFGQFVHSPRFLEVDFYTDGVVNLQDFAVIGKDWQAAPSSTEDLAMYFKFNETDINDANVFESVSESNYILQGTTKELLGQGILFDADLVKVPLADLPIGTSLSDEFSIDVDIQLPSDYEDYDSYNPLFASANMASDVVTGGFVVRLEWGYNGDYTRILQNLMLDINLNGQTQTCELIGDIPMGGWLNLKLVFDLTDSQAGVIRAYVDNEIEKVLNVTGQITNLGQYFEIGGSEELVTPAYVNGLGLSNFALYDIALEQLPGESRANLKGYGVVNMVDLDYFIEHWLEGD